MPFSATAELTAQKNSRILLLDAGGLKAGGAAPAPGQRNSQRRAPVNWE
jgi:hypothetical protein